MNISFLHLLKSFLGVLSILLLEYKKTNLELKEGCYIDDQQYQTYVFGGVGWADCKSIKTRREEEAAADEEARQHIEYGPNYWEMGSMK